MVWMVTVMAFMLIACYSCQLSLGDEAWNENRGTDMVNSTCQDSRHFLMFSQWAWAPPCWLTGTPLPIVPLWQEAAFSVSLKAELKIEIPLHSIWKAARFMITFLTPHSSGTHPKGQGEGMARCKLLSTPISFLMFCQIEYEILTHVVNMEMGHTHVLKAKFCGHVRQYPGFFALSKPTPLPLCASHPFQIWLSLYFASFLDTPSHFNSVVHLGKCPIYIWCPFPLHYVWVLFQARWHR